MEQKTGLRHNSIPRQWYNRLCGFLHRWRVAGGAETPATTDAHLYALPVVYGWSVRPAWQWEGMCVRSKYSVWSWSAPVSWLCALRGCLVHCNQSTPTYET